MVIDQSQAVQLIQLLTDIRGILQYLLGIVVLCVVIVLIKKVVFDTLSAFF